MRFSLLCLVFCLFGLVAQAQQLNNVPDSTFVPQISILTCGTGAELYSSFGHTGIRVRDSSSGLDEVYNYGTFDFSDPDFYSKFTLGKLLYYLDKSTYRNFLYTYEVEKRSVREQVLQLSPEQSTAFIAFLENNLKPENRSYLYDFLYDNCATRVRDIFPNTLGTNFSFGPVLDKEKVSFRKVINQYLSEKHWARLGINLLLGSPVDKQMSDETSMFLPDYLHKGLVHAQLSGKHLVQQENTILPGEPVGPRRVNAALWTMMGLLLLVVLSYLVKPFFYLRSILRFLLLLVSGLLGCLMLFMWFGTNHGACNANYNVLWAFPLNTVVAFLAHKRKAWLKVYALAAISLLIVSLLIHVVGVQQMPLIEMVPLMLCLMYVYIDLYKNNVQLNVAAKSKN